MSKTEKKRKTGLARLLELSGSKRWLLLLSALAALLNSLLTMVPYILVFYILSILLEGSIASIEIWSYLQWAALAIVVSFVLMFISAVASHLAAFGILYEIRSQIASRLGKLSMGYLNSRNSGSLKKILVDDVERIESFIAHHIPDAVKAFALPLTILGYLFWVDWRLALVSLLPLLLILLVMPRMLGTQKAKEAMQKYHTSLEDMNAGIIEFVRAMPVMKIFGQSASAFKKYSGTVEDFRFFVVHWTKISANVWGMMMSFLNNALLPVLALGLYFYFNQTLSLPVFILFLILGVGYIKPIFAMSNIANEIMAITHGVKRIDEILFDVAMPQSGTESNFSDFSITFQNLHFSYNEKIEVLKNINFNIPQGSITALVGPSGSGKSTLAQLVPRFYDTTQGNILIGNTDITEVPNDVLMQKVSFVFQDNMMFYETIYHNIQMGMDKTEAQVIEAAKLARCHDFISRLPKGYQTHFGDKGVHLSGGEQQRIQLARAILKDAPILILDEATAFSDPENEQLIMEAFNEVIQNKTVIIIAHRLSTIVGVNQIVVLDKGEVNAIGTHQELLATSDLYQTMWNAHSRAKEFEIVH